MVKNEDAADTAAAVAAPVAGGQPTTTIQSPGVGGGNDSSTESTGGPDQGTKSEVSLESVLNNTAAKYLEEDELRPNGIFKKGYRELSPYEATAFGGLTLKKTKNGQRAKSGIELEGSTSPKRN
jgi:hypothetical protein